MYYEKDQNGFNFNIFDLWEDGIVVLSPDGAILYTNESWERLILDEGSAGSTEADVLNLFSGFSEDPGSDIISQRIRDVMSGKISSFKLE